MQRIGYLALAAMPKLRHGDGSDHLPAMRVRAEMSDITLHQGDCLQFMRGMLPNSVDAVITDIPYGDINHVDRLHERAKGKGGPIRKLHKGNADDLNFDVVNMLDLIYPIFTQWACVFAGDKTGYIRSWFTEKDCMTRIGVWEKTNATPLHGQYIWLSSLEVIAIARKHYGTYNGFCESPVFRVPHKSETEHPTEKPLLLMKKIILNISNPGDTIFDPFMGSGTTGVACVQLGRKFIGCEIDPDYFAIAEKRIHEATLQPALLQVDAQVSAKQEKML